MRWSREGIAHLACHGDKDHDTLILVLPAGVSKDDRAVSELSMHEIQGGEGRLGCCCDADGHAAPCPPLAGSRSGGPAASIGRRLAPGVGAADALDRFARHGCQHAPPSAMQANRETRTEGRASPAGCGAIFR